jgi:type I restriction enzyme S subunit
VTREEFFNRFQLFAELPNAVAKMRKLILTLAVRGRLVPQLPIEGTADDLLRDLARLQKRPFSELAALPIEQWYPVPSSWRWIELGGMGRIVGGGTPRSDNPAYFSDVDGIPWLTPADLNGFDQKRIFRGRRFITERGLSESSAQLLPEGSVLFSSRAPIGYVAVAGCDLATNQGFKSCIP